MKPQEYKIKDFIYDLPESRIARYPLPERDLSKLLVYKDGHIESDIYRNLDKYISDESLLVFNNTKVVQARLHFKNKAGSRIEVFCLEPSQENAEPATAMIQEANVNWQCLIGGLDKWKEKVISKTTNNFELNAEIVNSSGNEFTIKFSWFPPTFSFSEILDQAGEIPIPPYLKRSSETIDVSRYQTVYAEQKGSVAAPTAGLHFTNSIFEKLKSKTVLIDYVTLHVGAGTFKPVKSETIGGHNMHSEWIEVEKRSVENLLKYSNKSESKNSIIAVGTTSLRTIESLYWMGVKAHQNLDVTLHDLVVKQWDAYELEQNLSAAESLCSLLAWMNKNKMEKLVCKTQILIVPSYHLKVVDALITNFHQPSSTLLLLIAAVVGDEWKTIYKYALDNDYRFLSYGDGSILFNNKKNKG